MRPELNNVKQGARTNVSGPTRYEVALFFVCIITHGHLSHRYYTAPLCDASRFRSPRNRKLRPQTSLTRRCPTQVPWNASPCFPLPELDKGFSRLHLSSTISCCFVELCSWSFCFSLCCAPGLSWLPLFIEVWSESARGAGGGGKITKSLGSHFSAGLWSLNKGLAIRITL